MQAACNQLCEDWVTSHPGRVMQVFDLPPISKRGLQLAAGESNITAGFRATGIWPLDRQIFQDIDFLPSSTTDRPFLDEEDIPLGANIEVPAHLQDDELDMQIDNYLNDIRNEESDASTPIGSVQDSDISTPIGSVLDLPAYTSMPAVSVQGNTSTVSVQELSGLLQRIKPYPKALPRKAGKRGRKPQKSTILTDDDHFEQIQAAKKAKDAKEEATAERKKAAAEKKLLVADRKMAAAAKKMAAAAKKNASPSKTSKAGRSKSPEAGPSKQQRVSQRRNTVTNYAPEDSTDSED